jgi:uncharacterized membrane protein
MPEAGPRTPQDGASPASTISWLRVAAGVLQGVFFLGYPVAVYYAHTRLETRALGLALLLLIGGGALLRMRGSWAEVGDLLKQHAGIAVMIALAVALDERVYLLFLPAAVSGYLFLTFLGSLRSGMPMIERFARIVEDDLPDFTLPYCRGVTRMWCGFFALNALAVCALALWAPLGWWAIYAGGVFYVLLGLLLGSEFVFRKLWFRYYTGGAADEFMARLFPADRTERGRRSLAYDEARRAGIAPAAETGG